MKRALLIMAAGAALGILLTIPGAAARGDGSIATDTSIVSSSITFFEAKLAADPRNTLVASRLADRYVLRFQTGAQLADLERAEALARVGARYALDGASSHARLSSVLLMQHEFGAALDAARRAFAEGPNRQGAAGALYDATMAAGRYAAADSALSRLERGSLGWRIRHAQRLDATGDGAGAYRTMSEACTRLENAGSRAAVQAWCLTELAGIAHGVSGRQSAERIVRRALTIQPGYRGALELRADLLAARGRADEANAIYRTIATDAHPDIYLRLAETSRARDGDAGALYFEAEFLRVARADGVEALYAQPLAIYYASRPATTDTARAIALRDLDRRQARESWDVLAWVEYVRGDLDAAIAASDHALAWGAPTPTMEYHRAVILYAMGRMDEADGLMHGATRDRTLLEPHARANLEQRGGARSQ